MRREGGAQGREGVRRGKGEGVGEGGTGLSDWFKRTCQASGHPAGLRGMVAKCSLAPKAMKAAKAMSCLRQPLGAVVSTEDTPQEELPLHLDACHSCAMLEVGIEDGSKLSEDYLGKRRRAYHGQHAGRIPPQSAFRYGLNETWRRRMFSLWARWRVPGKCSLAVAATQPLDHAPTGDE